MADTCPGCGHPSISHWYPEEVECLRAAIAQRDATIRAQDELLGRAREVLVDVGKRLSDALERMPEEVRGGD